MVQVIARSSTPREETHDTIRVSARIRALIAFVSKDRARLHQPGADSGGGIFNYLGTVTLANSTLSRNTVSDDGAGIFNHGGTLTLTNTTLSGNISQDHGGGIRGFGTITLTNCTISGNADLQGPGGIFVSGTVTLKNTIIANSGAGGNCLVAGTVTSYGHNLSDDGTCAGFLTAAGDLNGIPAGFDPNGLQHNGGPAQTIALLPTSAAVNAIPRSPINYARPSTA